MIKWNLRELAIKSLIEHPKNPRQIKKDQFDRLSGLIDKFGLIDKPIVNKDFTIIGGHQRVRVLKKKKVKFVECWVAEEQLSDEDVEELMIGVNLHQGQWDWDLMGDLWDPIQLLEYGFTEDQLLGSCKEDDDETEEKEKSSRKKQKNCPNCGCEL